VFFVLQLLVSLSSYNMKLAAHCEVRAEALLAIGRPTDKRLTGYSYAGLVDAFSPDGIDFKLPKNRIDQVVKFSEDIKEIVKG